MRRRRGFILIELLVVVAIMAVLLPSLHRAREHGKQAVCLSNMKQLVLAWTLYAEANNERMVNGMGGIPRPHEVPWVGRCWHDEFRKGEQLLEADQSAALQQGALRPRFAGLAPPGRDCFFATFHPSARREAVQHLATTWTCAVTRRRANAAVPVLARNRG
jgi:prepilin-type N-terminal cleavage/methylation domain-containing protein